MTVMNEIDRITAKRELVNKTHYYIELAKKVFNIDVSMPLVRMDLRGRVAGRACYSEWWVNYNYEIFICNYQNFLTRTIPHEVAHLIARQFYKQDRIMPHGWQWKHVMRKLGVNDVSRCHHYDTTDISTARPRPYVYTCGCSKFHLTSLLHGKILLGQKRWCKSCKKTLQFVREETA